MSDQPKPPKTGSFREGNPLFGKISHDKLAIRVHRAHLNLDLVKDYQEKGPITITNAGGSYWDIGFHAEAFVPWLAVLPQVGVLLLTLWLRGVLAERLAYLFVPLANPDWNWSNLLLVHYWLEKLNDEGFLLAESEVAFDFPGTQRPIRLLKPDCGHKFRTTLYSNDGVKKKRRVLVDGEIHIHSKGSRKDLVAEYNRGKKIRAGEPTWRLELRLSRFQLGKFSWWDFLVPFHWQLVIKFETFVHLLRAAVPAGSWSIRSEVLTPDLWYLRSLLVAAGWSIR